MPRTRPFPSPSTRVGRFWSTAAVGASETVVLAEDVAFDPDDALLRQTGDVDPGDAGAVVDGAARADHVDMVVGVFVPMIVIMGVIVTAAGAVDVTVVMVMGVDVGMAVGVGMIVSMRVLVGMDVAIAVIVGVGMGMHVAVVVGMGVIGVVDVIMIVAMPVIVVVIMVMMVVVVVVGVIVRADTLALDRRLAAAADRAHHSTSNSATRMSSPPVI